jgi:hypothetical protein
VASDVWAALCINSNLEPLTAPTIIRKPLVHKGQFYSVCILLILVDRGWAAEGSPQRTGFETLNVGDTGLTPRYIHDFPARDYHYLGEQILNL